MAKYYILDGQVLYIKSASNIMLCLFLLLLSAYEKHKMYKSGTKMKGYKNKKRDNYLYNR